VDRGRRLAIGVVGVAVLFLAAGLGLRLAGGGDVDTVDLSAPPSMQGLGDDMGEVQAGPGIQPGDPPLPFDPSLPAEVAPGPGDAPVTLPPPGVVTIPLPDFSTGQATGTGGSGTTARPAAPAFSEAGVWVVKADGTSPALVARGATAGVAAGGTWVAFLEGGTVRAVRRTDLRSKRDLATGVAGTVAQGLPISGGRGGVAYLKAGRVVLVDPGAPAQAVSYEAVGADAVAAEEDGAGRLVWADDGGIHVGPETVSPTAEVQRGMLEMGHGVLASLQEGQVRLRDGTSLGWGGIDRLQTGPGGLVAASGGRVRLRTPAGESRVVLDRASTPVVTATRILYVSSGRSAASASLAGTGSTVVASAAPGRAITSLDLLDDTTLVVTVA